MLKPRKKQVTEKQIEQYLCREVKKLGGTAYKFSSPARRAVPDRLCVMPGGVACFVECKRPGKEPTAAQWKEIHKLSDLWHDATWVDSKAKIDALMSHLKDMIKESEEYT